ncbi:hypothetical protein AAC387_Pa11g0816 [Persea americana]
MQTPSAKRFHLEQKGSSPGTPHRYWSRPLSLKKSVKDTAREVVGMILTCFNPQQSKAGKGDDGEADLYQVKEISFSSKDLTESNNSNSSKKFKYSSSCDSDNAHVGTIKFSITDIYKATGNFSTANQIGQGGFGTVYKGVLKDGTVVAVKRAKKNLHDRRLSMEFKNEIETLSKVEHLNLVRFLGYLDHPDERIIVVEYVGNGTLRDHLYGSGGHGLDLAERLDIAIDVAHAVTYLHMYTDPPIIHRDIKASNILITEKVRAKVADFGFARLNANDSGATHISTQIKGTAGYLDPEYLMTYQLTEKSDVYSFGVLLVELMTGRHPIEPKKELKEKLTVRWHRDVFFVHMRRIDFGKVKNPNAAQISFGDGRAMQKLKEGDVALAMDPKLRKSPAANSAAEKVLKLAAECLAPSKQSRPSMKRCAEVLWGIRRDYREIEFSSSSSRRRGSFYGKDPIIQKIN